MHLTGCSYHLTYPFQSESTLYGCLNVKEVLARNRCKIWSLTDCNWTWTHNHLVRKPTVNHFAKLTKWFTWVVSAYLYGAFAWMFLSCHVRVSGWINTLNLPEDQGTPSPKQARNLKFKWLQLESNLILLSSSTNTQPFGQTELIIELSSEYLSVRCIWLYVFVTSRTRLRVNPLSIVAWMSRNSLIETGAKSEV